MAITKVYPDKLDEHIQQAGLSPVYIVAGEEPLLHMEACDTLRRHVRNAGIEERDILQVENGFAWQQLTESASSMSLFGDKKLIELRMGTQSPGQEGGKALAAYAAGARDSGNILLLSAGRLDYRTQQSQWFKTLAGCGVFVAIWPIEFKRLGWWIKQRAGRYGLELDQDASSLMAVRYEGNLLAADQALARMQLLMTPGVRISADALMQYIEEGARYDVFTLSDAWLGGDRPRSLRILQGLKGEGIEPPIILWAITRELRTLLSLHQHIDQGQSIDQACKAQRPSIPERRRSLYQQAMNRLPRARLHKLLLFAQRLDLTIKGGGHLPIWQGLDDVVLTLSGGRGPLTEWPAAYRVRT